MPDEHQRQELRPHLRDEPVPDDTIVVVGGGPTMLAKLTEHARRTHGAFVLDGQPLWGVSVFCALDDIGPSSLDGRLQRFASYRIVHLPRAGRLREEGFELLPSFGRPHFTIRIGALSELPQLLDALGPAETNPYHGRGIREEVAVVSVDITCDLMDEDESGYVWTFLREARDPSLIEPGAIVVAGDEETPAVADVMEIIEKPAGSVVRLRLLPGAIEDYEALVRRAITPA